MRLLEYDCFERLSPLISLIGGAMREANEETAAKESSDEEMETACRPPKDPTVSAQ